MTLQPRRRILATAAVLVAAVAGSATADGSELVLSREAMQALVATTLFRDGGRWYLQKGGCAAYLEHPEVALVQGRLVIDAHLAGKAGLQSQGGCLGVDLASQVTLSGVLRGSGSELSVQDVRVDRASDDTTRQALVLLLGAASESVSHALRIDLMSVVKPTAIPGLTMPARVTRLTVADVVTGPQSVTVHFDLGVAIP